VDDIVDLLILGAIGGAFFLWWRSRQAQAATSSPAASRISPATHVFDPSGSSPGSPLPDFRVYAAPGTTPAPQPTSSSTSTSSRPSRISASGETFIKNIEGLRLQRYPDAGGYSIGYGHFIQPGEAIGATITPAIANQLFEGDIATVEHALNSLVTVPQLTQSEYDALADLVFNIGADAFGSSTLLKKLNAGDYPGAAAEFGRWVYSQGNILPALVDRRKKDAQLFATGWGNA
jgi:lysozyme